MSSLISQILSAAGTLTAYESAIQGPLDLSRGVIVDPVNARTQFTPVADRESEHLIGWRLPRTQMVVTVETHLRRSPSSLWCVEQRRPQRTYRPPVRQKIKSGLRRDSTGATRLSEVLHTKPDVIPIHLVPDGDPLDLLFQVQNPALTKGEYLAQISRDATNYAQIMRIGGCTPDDINHFKEAVAQD